MAERIEGGGAGDVHLSVWPAAGGLAERGGSLQVRQADGAGSGSSRRETTGGAVMLGSSSRRTSPQNEEKLATICRAFAAIRPFAERPAMSAQVFQRF